MVEQSDLDQLSDAIAEAAPAWGIHIVPFRWPRSAGRVFLAEAAKQLGAAMFLEWSGDELGWMLQGANPPLIPAVDDAFAAGDPIAEVHELFGPAVRRIMSVPLYQQLELLRAPIEEWMANLVPDPDGGDPIIAPDLRMRRGEGHADPISRDHWEKAYWHAEVQRSEFNGSRMYVPLIADTIIELAQSGKLATFARPFGGGETIALPASAWEIDDGMHRLSTCTLDPNRPFDPAATHTHFVFVDASDLAAAIPQIEQVCLLEMPAPARKSDDSGPREDNVVSIRTTRAADGECERWLLEKFADPSTGGMTRGQFKADAQRRSEGRLSGHGFKRAWDAAVLMFPDRGRPGPRGA